MNDKTVRFIILRQTNPIDGTYDLGPGPKISPEEQEQAYPMSRNPY